VSLVEGCRFSQRCIWSSVLVQYNTASLRNRFAIFWDSKCRDSISQWRGVILQKNGNLSMLNAFMRTCIGTSGQQWYKPSIIPFRFNNEGTFAWSYLDIFAQHDHSFYSKLKEYHNLIYYTIGHSWSKNDYFFSKVKSVSVCTKGTWETMELNFHTFLFRSVRSSKFSRLSPLRSFLSLLQKMEYSAVIHIAHSHITALL
jgi:hypothetical protein